MTKKSILVLFVCCFAFLVTSVAMLMYLQQAKSQPQTIARGAVKVNDNQEYRS